MIDDPGFDPIIDYIESQDKTLTGHIGEPRDCWLPLGEMTSESNRRYYERNPQYHMHLHPEYPAYEAHIRAVEQHAQQAPEAALCGLPSGQPGMERRRAWRFSGPISERGCRHGRPP